MKMSGAQAMAECLKEQGVDTLFGYPGGTILPFYDALYDSGIRHVTAAHEQGAIHSADGYARASGRVGVCIATSGPGATNLTTGLAAAYLDSVPLVAITGQVPVGLIGRDAFQEVDIIGITLSVTKYSVQVKRPEKLVETLRLAMQVAASGRPGPVLVDVPRDIQTASVDYEAPKALEKGQERSLTGSQERLLDQAAALLMAAKRPLILSGGGVLTAKAQTSCRQMAEKNDLPLVTTLMGAGVLPDGHHLALGIVGVSGNTAANAALKEADLILALGCRFSEQTISKDALPLNAAILHLDIDPAELERRLPAALALAGDLRLLIPALTQRLPEGRRELCFAAREAEALLSLEDEPLDWAWLFAWLGRRLQSEAVGVIALEPEGWHKEAFHGLSSTEQTLLFPGGLGCRGYALPAALGAQLAAPERTVIAFCGLEGLLRSGNELYTLAAQGLPVLSVVLTEEEDASAFLQMAQAYGMNGQQAKTRQELIDAWEAAWKNKAPQMLLLQGRGGG
ncbi:thiamine pyrophosphate-binding protein [Azotosporobacter soli]|uniref:thiamine pyrophosphate-binding protein n=1 Tax=Azotosporobacter soli TaxID=3055040 RepID=UPI0031FF0F81